MRLFTCQNTKGSGGHHLAFVSLSLALAASSAPDGLLAIAGVSDERLHSRLRCLS